MIFLSIRTVHGTVTCHDQNQAEIIINYHKQAE